MTSGYAFISIIALISYLFLFLTLPEGFDAVAFYDKALSAGVAYVAGEFFHPDRSGRNTMRLNFSFMSPEKIVAGIKVLSGLLVDGVDSRSGRE